MIAPTKYAVRLSYGHVSDPGGRSSGSPASEGRPEDPPALPIYSLRTTDPFDRAVHPRPDWEKRRATERDVVRWRSPLHRPEIGLGTGSGVSASGFRRPARTDARNIAALSGAAGGRSRSSVTGSSRQEAYMDQRKSGRPIARVDGTALFVQCPGRSWSPPCRGRGPPAGGVGRPRKSANPEGWLSMRSFSSS